MGECQLALCQLALCQLAARAAAAKFLQPWAPQRGAEGAGVVLEGEGQAGQGYAPAPRQGKHWRGVGSCHGPMPAEQAESPEPRAQSSEPPVPAAAPSRLVRHG